jgi:hypothetical protein
MALDPEIQSKLALWKAKAADGTITVDDMKAAIFCLRANRKAAQLANESSGRKASTKKPTRSADEMLDELEGL